MIIRRVVCPLQYPDPFFAQDAVLDHRSLKEAFDFGGEFLDGLGIL